MKELLKATESGHPDHVYIQEAVKAMNSVASVRTAANFDMRTICSLCVCFM